MQFTTVFTASFLLLASLVSAAPKPEEKGFEVVIKYVRGPDCNCDLVACGENATSTTTTSSCTTESYYTVTSTNTKYVIVTLQTNYGTTETLGYATSSVAPSYYTNPLDIASSTCTTSTDAYVPAPTY